MTTLAEPPPTAERTPEPRALKLLCQAADSVLGHSDFLDVLHTSRRGGLALIRHAGGLKVFKFIGCTADWKKRWARLIGWNPARRAREMSAALSAVGILVCTVEEYGSVSLPEAPRAVWTLSRYVENGRTLRQVKEAAQYGVRSPRHPEVLRLFGEGLKLLRRIHDLGFEHRDYHAGNLLVTPGDDAAQPVLWLVDLETVMRRRAGVRRRARDVRRYLENFVEPADYLQVIEGALDTYAAGDASLKSRILATRRMRGLLAKRGARWDGD